jgi:hypothetical protein
MQYGDLVGTFSFFAKVFAKFTFRFRENICDENTKLAGMFSRTVFAKNFVMCPCCNFLQGPDGWPFVP